MLETALKGSPRYWGWLGILLAVMGIGGAMYMWQFTVGLTVTGLSRDVSWGFYIAQFTYLVGVAAAGVMVVLPYYFHHYKDFKKLIILAEFQAVAAVIMCLGFIVVDLGQPTRMLNVLRYPTPNSILFWDMVVLNGYLLLNIVIGWVSLQHERNHVEPPKWVKPLVYTSIIWAFSIHTVTAFLYQGLPGRHYWLTAILAARFLASAFCSGPAILLLVAMLVRKVSDYDVGDKAIKALAKIVAYAMAVNVFFFLLELFTAAYSNIPGHMHSFEFLFAGHDGHMSYVSYLMWVAAILAIASLALLIPPKLRDNMKLLPWSLAILIAASWIDKGLGLLIGGFTPNAFEGVTPYAPTLPEIMISLMVYAMGIFALTILYKVAVSVKREVA
ncbi:putative sulfite reductase-associated electron transfer protein DsrP [Desulfocurvibacter africanus PCS]|uniref:Putative sulfite reductase-associated electron transfer protein DsrP n=1 Tax=Desulfocurvibacter africanus PCS TaxID=1262666 RepID=M5Q0P7_DESAF|nr:NrfD/PsrC family molybdoenzyme membrane anchor subunit [Desulfocurvibacter africanus]EMG35863.1 putative sulfite reductase-associated electron transfer protein DsrP [Desulfocurvibacter africanus PCS]